VWCPKSASGAYLSGWHGFDVDEGHGFPCCYVNTKQCSARLRVVGVMVVILVRSLRLALSCNAGELLGLQPNSIHGNGSVD